MSRLVLAAAAAEETNPLPAPPLVLGLIAFLILVALLMVTWSFKR